MERLILSTRFGLYYPKTSKVKDGTRGTRIENATHLFNHKTKIF